MKPPNIVTVHFLSAKWSKKLFTINHYELQNGKCIVTQELSAYFKKGIHPLREKLRSLVDTEQDADDYMNIVFSLCAAYERQGYIEGIKVGARLMMED